MGRLFYRGAAFDLGISSTFLVTTYTLTWTSLQ
jgi:hypothetical protein